MSCEKLQNGAIACAHSQPLGSHEQEELAQIAIDLATNCDGYKRTHTSKILAELSGRTTIPDFLRKQPEKQEILVRHGLLVSVSV